MCRILEVSCQIFGIRRQFLGKRVWLFTAVWCAIGCSSSKTVLFTAIWCAIGCSSTKTVLFTAVWCTIGCSSTEIVLFTAVWCAVGCSSTQTFSVSCHSPDLLWNQQPSFDGRLAVLIVGKYGRNVKLVQRWSYECVELCVSVPIRLHGILLKQTDRPRFCLPAFSQRSPCRIRTYCYQYVR